MYEKWDFDRWGELYVHRSRRLILYACAEYVALEHNPRQFKHVTLYEYTGKHTGTVIEDIFHA